MTESLPAGVHRLSAESQAALARAKAKSDAIMRSSNRCSRSWRNW